MPGTIWSVDFVKSREGQLDNYLKFTSSYWKPARDETTRRGHTTSYRMLVLPGNPEWDVILMTEYPDDAAFAAREANFRPVLAALHAERPARYTGPPRPELADIVLTRVFRAPPATNPAPPAPR